MSKGAQGFVYKPKTFKIRLTIDTPKNFDLKPGEVQKRNDKTNKTNKNQN